MSETIIWFKTESFITYLNFPLGPWADFPSGLWVAAKLSGYPQPQRF